MGDGEIQSVKELTLNKKDEGIECREYYREYYREYNRKYCREYYREYV